MDRRSLLRAGVGALGAAGLGAIAPGRRSLAQAASGAPLDLPVATAVFGYAIQADSGAELYRKAASTPTRFPASLVKLA